MVSPQSIIAAGSQIFKRGNQSAVKIEDVCFEIKLCMWRELLDAEITTMKHMNLALIDTFVERSVSTIFPALESLSIRIYDDIFEFYRSINRCYIDRQHPFMLAQRLHLQEMVYVPVAQRWMITQQGYRFAFVQTGSMNLEDDGLAEKRHTFHTLIRFHIHFWSSTDSSDHVGSKFLLQPEIIKDITLGRIIRIYSR